MPVTGGERRGAREQTARAGEFYVAAELCRRGAGAAVLSGNTPGFDVLAWDADRRRVVQIQVKTKRRGDWHTSKRLIHELGRDADARESRYWVFVDLGQEAGPTLPRFWVVPEGKLIELLEPGIAEWKRRNPNSTADHCAIRQGNLRECWAEDWPALGILP